VEEELAGSEPPIPVDFFSLSPDILQFLEEPFPFDEDSSHPGLRLSASLGLRLSEPPSGPEVEDALLRFDVAAEEEAEAEREIDEFAWVDTDVDDVDKMDAMYAESFSVLRPDDFLSTIVSMAARSDLRTASALMFARRIERGDAHSIQADLKAILTALRPPKDRARALDREYLHEVLKAMSRVLKVRSFVAGLFLVARPVERDEKNWPWRDEGERAVPFAIPVLVRVGQNFSEEGRLSSRGYRVAVWQKKGSPKDIVPSLVTAASSVDFEPAGQKTVYFDSRSLRREDAEKIDPREDTKSFVFPMRSLADRGKGKHAVIRVDAESVVVDRDRMRFSIKKGYWNPFEVKLSMWIPVYPFEVDLPSPGESLFDKQVAILLASLPEEDRASWERDFQELVAFSNTPVTTAIV
jgi:hypothetical protein